MSFLYEVYSDKRFQFVLGMNDLKNYLPQYSQCNNYGTFCSDDFGVLYMPPSKRLQDSYIFRIQLLALSLTSRNRVQVP